MASTDDILTIASLPAFTENYQLLRERAMEYIRQTTSATWTDHNVHDPGITILEAICYALGDAGFRMNFPMHDLMLDDNGTMVKHAWYLPEEILPSRPVTIKDYRKLLLDVPGVRNAWILPVTKTTTGITTDYEPVFFDKDNGRLIHAHEISAALPPLKRNEILARPVFIQGLYAVSLEFDESPVYGNLNSGEAFEAVFTTNFSGTVYYDIPKWQEIINDRGLVSNLKNAYTNNADTITISLQPSLKNRYNNSDGKLLTRKMVQWYWTVEISDASGKILSLPDVYFEFYGTPQMPVLGQVVSDILSDKNFYDALFERIILVANAYEGIQDTLKRNRNLCEDFLPQLSAIPETELRFCADIDVKPLHDIEQVQAEIFNKIEEAITPPIRFYSFDEMKAKGFAMEEILEGPRLQHGFLPDGEIGNDNWENADIFLSDIINAIYETDGLENCRNAELFLVDASGKKINNVNKWIVEVPSGYKPKLNKRKSKLTFYKNGVPLTPHFLETIQKYQILRSASGKWADGNVPSPAWNTTYRNLAQHFTLADEFPATYKIGRNFPLEKDDDRDWANSRQLEGYLLLFDQVIANLLKDLDNLKYTLSWNDIHWKKLYDAPTDDANLDALEKANRKKNSWRRNFHFAQESIKVETRWQQILESREVFLENRNATLDFLLARFAEDLRDLDFNFFSTIDNTKTSRNQFFETLNGIKQRYLANYILLSMHRSAGVEAFLHPTFKETPLSGFEKRLESLLNCKLADEGKRLFAADLPDEPVGAGHFILLEHILLRNPRFSQLISPAGIQAQLSICADNDCTGCAGSDPFSFTATLVLPAWLNVYQDMQYRDFIERLLRREAPVGVLLRICWLKKEDLENFETALDEWWAAKYNWYKNVDGSIEALLQALLNKTGKLIEIMKKQRSVYLPATLHGCDDEELENNTRVFLNKTTISEL